MIFDILCFIFVGGIYVSGKKNLFFMDGVQLPQG